MHRIALRDAPCRKAGLSHQSGSELTQAALTGLGRSGTARRYGIDGLDQARRYLADPVLGERLRTDVRLVLGHTERSAHAIFGTPDDIKFRSCLTLFERAAEGEADKRLFGSALEAFYGGDRDPLTIDLLRS